MTELETLTQTIAALEAQRATLGDAVVDAMLAPARGFGALMWAGACGSYFSVQAGFGPSRRGRLKRNRWAAGSIFAATSQLLSVSIKNGGTQWQHKRFNVWYLYGDPPQPRRLSLLMGACWGGEGYLAEPKGYWLLSNILRSKTVG